MSDKNNPAPVVTSNQGGIRTEESPTSVPQGGMLSIPGWTMDPKLEVRLRRMKERLEYALAHDIGVESAAWSVARDLDALLDIHGSAPVDQVDLFEPMSVGQAKVLNQMLQLCEWKP